MKTSLQELLSWGKRKLLEAGVKEAELDARYLLCEAFGLDLVSFLMNRSLELEDTPENAEQQRSFFDLINRRCGRIPLQYMIGKQEFMGLEFQVNPHVLIPRQDTETLVELVLKEQTDRNIAVLDLCTGSGCIAISLKRLGEFREVWGGDISAEALGVAKENGQRNGTHITWVQGDMFEPFLLQPAVFEVIVSNPPYIPTEVIKGLEPEVRDFEPVSALDGREDGLSFYRKLAEECHRYLKPRGSVYFEIGYNQGEAVSRLLCEAGYTEIEVIKDEPGLDRVVKGIYSGGFHV